MFPFPKTMKMLLLYSFFSALHHFVHAKAPPYELCSNTTISTTNSIFDYNLEKLLDSLSSNASVSKFYTTKMGNDQDRLFGLFLCYNFVETQKCENCIASAIQDIKNRCENRNEAVMWEENC